MKSGVGMKSTSNMSAEVFDVIHFVDAQLAYLEAGLFISDFLVILLAIRASMGCFPAFFLSRILLLSILGNTKFSECLLLAE